MDEQPITERLERLKSLLQIEDKERQVAKLRLAMEQPDFWNDHKAAAEVARELTRHQEVIDSFNYASLDPNDPSAASELEKLELASLFSGPYDQNNAIIGIHAGAGGTEAQDWAEMLLRMFQRYGERQGWQVALLDQSSGEEVGIKSATLEVKGPMAYGNLQSEAGVHRLVRISPYDAAKARHTSFALVEVTPEVEKAAEIEIKPEELKIDVFRSGGKGGQSVNTTDSAVRLTHLPTGLVVTCQNERSQLQNKEKAMQILISRLLQRQQIERRQEQVELRGEHVSAEWGHQIRSYVLQPYQMVKDHRTGVESPNPSAVLDGALDPFIEGYLRHQANNQLGEI